MKKVLIISLLAGAVLLAACSPVIRVEGLFDRYDRNYRQDYPMSRFEGRRPGRGNFQQDNFSRGRFDRDDDSFAGPHMGGGMFFIERWTELLDIDQDELIDRLENGETMHDIAESLGFEMPCEELLEEEISSESTDS